MRTVQGAEIDVLVLRPFGGHEHRLQFCREFELPPGRFLAQRIGRELAVFERDHEDVGQRLDKLEVLDHRAHPVTLLGNPRIQHRNRLSLQQHGNLHVKALAPVRGDHRPPFRAGDHRLRQHACTSVRYHQPRPSAFSRHVECKPIDVQMLCQTPTKTAQQVLLRRAPIDGARHIQQGIQFVILNPKPPLQPSDPFGHAELLLHTFDILLRPGIHLDPVSRIDEQRHAHFHPRVHRGRLQGICRRIALDPWL